jgi:hypothetical protein
MDFPGKNTLQLNAATIAEMIEHSLNSDRTVDQPHIRVLNVRMVDHESAVYAFITTDEDIQ